MHPANMDLMDDFDEAVAMITQMREVFFSFLDSHIDHVYSQNREQRGKNMPDAQRREMASSLILRLAASFGLDDDEEDSE